MYETNPNTNGYCLAGTIYGPSYLSFDFALYYYGLIPEKATAFTSATFGKKKKKMYENEFGTFLYRDVPSSVYPLGINLIEENGYYYQIAIPEKALCDKLYTLSPIKNMTELENVLYNDLRIDAHELNKFKTQDLREIAKAYHSTNVDMLYRYLRRKLENE